MNTMRRVECKQLTRAARQWLAAGDVSRALQLIDQALRLEPGAATARLVQAAAMLRSGRPDEALAAIHAADWHRQTHNQSPWPARFAIRMHAMRGEALLRLGRRAEAQKAYEAAVRINPYHRRAVMKLASLLIATGRADRAINPLWRYHLENENDRGALRLLGEAFEACGQIESAIQVRHWLGIGSRAEDGKARVSRAMALELARLHKDAGRIADAAGWYHKLMQGGEVEADLAVEAAKVAAERGDEASVIEYLTAALRCEPDHRGAAVVLAERHMRSGRFPAAAGLWCRLWRRDERDAEAVAGLIVCAMSARRFAFAQRFIERLHHLLDADASRTLLMGMWGRAMRGLMVHQALRLHEAPTAANPLADLLADACATFERRLAEHDDWADLHYHRAVCLEAQGESKQAASCLDRALEINARYKAAADRRAALTEEHKRHAA